VHAVFFVKHVKIMKIELQYLFNKKWSVINNYYIDCNTTPTIIGTNT